MSFSGLDPNATMALGERARTRATSILALRDEVVEVLNSVASSELLAHVDIDLENVAGATHELGGLLDLKGQTMILASSGMPSVSSALEAELEERTGSLLVALGGLGGTERHDSPFDIDGANDADTQAELEAELKKAQDLAAVLTGPEVAMTKRNALVDADGETLNTAISLMTDEQVEGLFEVITPGLFNEAALTLVTGVSSDELLVNIGEKVNVQTWTRLGQFTERIDPTLADGAGDGASPATFDKFGRLIYLDRSDWTLYGQGNTQLDPIEIQQGYPGDCYLIAGMQALGIEDPSNFDNIVKQNSNGTYTVTFGDGHQEVVSPLVPYDPVPPRDAFAHTKSGGVLFPALVEKAYAQRYGGYGKVGGGGSMSGAVENLTGRKSEWVPNKNVSLAELAERRDRGEILGIATIDQPDNMTRDEWLKDPNTPDTFKGKGLHQNHAFIVLDIDEAAGTITLGNPWDLTVAPVVITEAELKESIDGVYTNEAAHP